MPAHNGGLFSDKAHVSRVGADLAKLTLPNESFETVLRSLLVIETAEEVPGPVDFRSLGVHEFGTIYEGLLESELSIAETDLAVDKRGAYLPARKKNKVVKVPAGGVYLRNRSGVRKSSGSYYTKPFAVEHLLDGALDPALDDHFRPPRRHGRHGRILGILRLPGSRYRDGSGHFLIAAIDHIEKRMADLLTTRRLRGVQRELAALRSGSGMRQAGPEYDREPPGPASTPRNSVVERRPQRRARLRRMMRHAVDRPGAGPRRIYTLQSWSRRPR